MSKHDTEILSSTKVRQSHHPWENRIKGKYYYKYKYSHNSVNNPIYPPPKEDYKTEDTSQEHRIKFTVIGNRVTKEFIYCLYLVKGLFKYRHKHFEAPIITGVTGVEWPKVWNDLKIRYGDLAFCLKSQVAVFKDDQFLGGEDELKQFVETKYVYRLYLDYNKEGILQFTNYIKASGRPCAYLQISINKEPIGSLIFMDCSGYIMHTNFEKADSRNLAKVDAIIVSVFYKDYPDFYAAELRIVKTSIISLLYADIAPLTCQNFLQMCEKVKGGYGGSPIHRIVKDCWIQCGGYDLKSPTNLACENFIVPHDRRGVLCMANDGRDVDCSTQFIVLLEPASWMENKYVAFGQLIDGERTLNQIENVPTWYESPTSDIIIDKAGILNLDCQKIPINKNTNAYIQGHFENLVAIGEMFYEALLEKVFMEVELRIAKRHQNIEEFLYHKYSIAAATSDSLISEGHHDTIASDGITEDNNVQALKTGEKVSESRSEIKPLTVGITEENDVQALETEKKDSGRSSEIKPPTVKSNSVILEKPVKPFYLPLTDVPYLGEVDSEYNLEKFMRGDYCLESDLEKFPKRARLYGNSTRAVPAELIDQLFEYLIHDTNFSPDLKSDLDFHKKVDEIYRDDIDKASFAGRVVKKMATLDQLSHKDLFEGKIDEVLSDDTLRMIRVVAKESRNTCKQAVSIKYPGMPSKHKISRRLTGMFRPGDLRINSTGPNRGDKTEVKEESKELRIIDAVPDQQDTSLPPSLPNEFKSTVLHQIFRDVAVDYEPSSCTSTCQNYISPEPLPVPPSILKKMDNTERKKSLRQPKSTHLVTRTLNLQQDTNISNKILSYPDTSKNNFEFGVKERSLKYLKRQPSLTIAEYQMKNQKYREDLKLQQSLNKK